MGDVYEFIHRSLLVIDPIFAHRNPEEQSLLLSLKVRISPEGPRDLDEGVPEAADQGEEAEGQGESDYDGQDSLVGQDVCGRLFVGTVVEVEGTY